MSSPPLGVILAGGASSRFGAPKALATLAGERIIDRVAGALSRVATDIVIIVNDSAIAAVVPFESRADVVRGVGPLAGVLTALEWARELRHDRIIAVGCDMPFIDPGLLRLMDRRAASLPRADVVLPASRGPRGVEPLCAIYRTTCIGPVRDAIERGDPRMVGFHPHVRIEVLPIEEVLASGDPDVLFMNVNTRGDLERAESLVAGRP